PPRNLRLKAFVESGEGTATILLCVVESNPLSQLTLLKGGQLVASSPPGDGDPPVSPSPNTLRLELRAATAEDEGEYECWAQSPLGSTHASLSLRVLGAGPLPPAVCGAGGTLSSRCRRPPGALVHLAGGAAGGAAGRAASPCHPTLQGLVPCHQLFAGRGGHCRPVADAPQEPSFISLVEPRGGRQAVLLCTVNSVPPSDIALLRGPGGVPLASAGGSPDPRVTVQATPNSLRVDLGGLQLRDAGVYVCTANNSHGAAAASLRLDLGGVTVTIEPSPEVPEGATATMTCWGVPWVGDEANYTWYRDSRWLQEGPTASLVLTGVSSANAGSYRCRASGARGSATSVPVTLSVLCECPLAPGPHTTAHRQPRPPHADPPRDVSVSTFLENRSGRVGIVSCTADSHPPSAIALYHRGRLLASSLAPAAAPPGVRVSPSHNALRLELGAVGPGDAGEYTCVAGNPLGNATASADFDVRTLTHLLAVTVVAGLLAAVVCAVALALLAIKLWPR
ncbi:SN protein, partial [Syrrhaptes paradoxus]|nr:SN protein [Syrrhaptes paradoxus]